MIADNKLGLNSAWNMEILPAELQVLADAGFDITLTGFEPAEADTLLADADEASTTLTGPEDDHPPPPAVVDTVSRLGDHFLIGRHALICGDARTNLFLRNS